ncbi:MAG TPA: DUF2207 domain-containing protein [Methanoregulaceae archaeon]|nr:DUF2207 domain-containing protein [Methanoregulaceae archaeon]
MNEKRQIATLVIITLVIGIVVVLFTSLLGGLMEGDLVIDNYQASFTEDGALSEEYSYEVKSSGQYRMLFRFWEDDLSINPLQSPYIEFKEMRVPPGVVGYVKDYQGDVTLNEGKNPAYIAFIRSMAENNEVGIYNPSYYPAGTYDVGYSYILHPPVEYDDQLAHLNIRLVDQHIPYRSLTITYPARYVREIYTHPPGLEVERTGDTYVITGSVAGNEVLGIELLLSKEAMTELQGFPRVVPDVAEQTRAANPWYNIIPFYAAWALYLLGIVMVLLTPFLFLAIYHRYGREKKFTVPQYLSFIPHPEMKPWEVNLIFKGDATNFDADGYYATLLDMHRKKILTIHEKAGGEAVVIRVNQDHSEDGYEERVLAFLREVGTDGVVDSDELGILAEQAKTDKMAESRIIRYQQALSGVTRRTNPRLIARYIVDGRDHIIPLVFIGAAFCVISIIISVIAIPLIRLLVPSAILWGFMILESGIALAFPSTLFGHWKGDGYKEKLEWDAFAYFLSDLALMKKYAPSDISMWGEWLVYGTALGVGDKVVKAMKDLDISIPEADVPLGVRTAFFPVLFFAPPSSGGGGGFGGGGSFGGGGGFGGGGVGGR